MTTPILTFFNNQGGVGKTTLLYHLAWIFADLGKCVVVADLDPQANLTAAFLPDEQIEKIWDSENTEGKTIFQCVKPLTEVGDIIKPDLQKINSNLYLIPGDVRLSSFEDSLSQEWPQSLGPTPYRSMRILSAFWGVMQMSIEEVSADIVLVDVGPNLGAINRAVLIATDHVIVPLAADLFSLKGLENLGPALIDWKEDWNARLNHWRSKDRQEHKNFKLPEGKMGAIGYLCQQYGVRLDGPVQAYKKWVDKMPKFYTEAVLNKKENMLINGIDDDPNCLGTIKHYRSLIAMGQEKRKPIFHLKPADGAIGAHMSAVEKAGEDFEELAKKVADKISMPV